MSNVIQMPNCIAIFLSLLIIKHGTNLNYFIDSRTLHCDEKLLHTFSIQDSYLTPQIIRKIYKGCKAERIKKGG